LDTSRTAAKEDVIATFLTEGAPFLIACKIPVVPITAGSRRSCINVKPQLQLIPVAHLLYVFGVEVKGTSCVDDSFKRGVGKNSIFECIRLRNILDDFKIKLVFLILRKDFLDIIGFTLAPHSSDNRVSVVLR
jgi:hypothetical protein